MILTYDVGKKRVAKVMKICRKYLHHKQNSVFEGAISQAMLMRLKKELEPRIHTELDTICIYKFNSLKYARREEIGAVKLFDNIIE